MIECPLFGVEPITFLSKLSKCQGNKNLIDIEKRLRSIVIY